MNKKTLLRKILAHLEAELALYSQSARSAHAEATHEQNKAENKYDTRALEASYLAHGQSRQAAETESARQHFEALELQDFEPEDPIDLTALVELESGSERTFYFLGPKAGGTEIEHAKQRVLVITPQSPLGRQLVGRKRGDKLKIEIGGTRSEYKVVKVS